MKSLSVISLALLISACGADNSSSNEEEQQQRQIDSGLSFSDYENLCGQNPVSSFEPGAIVLDDTKQFKFQPLTSEATLEIQNSDSSVCIYGDFAKLVIAGENNEVYVSGDVEYVQILGSKHDILVFGDVQSIDIEGDENAVQFNSVAVINEDGEYNLLIDGD